MDDLIIRHLNGTASPFEEERLRRWREESVENEVRFKETVHVWTLTEPEPLATDSTPPPVETILARAQDRPIPLGTRSPQPAPARAPKRQMAWGRWALLAASVAALALGIPALLPNGPAPLARYQASPAASLTVALADGSFVRLAPGSELTEWASDGSREVDLDGRAFFAVARDESRPFTVNTGAGAVSVLGTRFEVLEEGRDLRAVVVEGRVRVGNDRGSVEVGAGEVATITGRGTPSARAVDDVYALLGWQDGILIYQATPLAQVAREVERHFGRRLTVTGGALGERRITAWFENEPFQEVAESLCLASGAVCTTDEDGITMGPGAGGGE